MTNTTIWLVILGLSAMVVTMRWSFLILPRRFQPKGALAQALGFAPLAALVAICMPEVMKFQIESFKNPSLALFGAISNDWRLWGGLAMLVVTITFRSSKSAALFGLIAAALIVFLIK
jgi:branched-subunit amino acid transport protein